MFKRHRVPFNVQKALRAVQCSTILLWFVELMPYITTFGNVIY